MTVNPLVESILDEIAIKVIQGNAYTGKKSSAAGRPLVLLCGSDFEREQVLKALDAAAKASGPLTVALTRSAEAFFKVEDLKKRASVSRVLLESDRDDMGRWLKSVKQVWCPNVTQNTLVKLSQGMTDSMGTCILWWALSYQIPVTLNVSSACRWTARLPKNHAMTLVLDEAAKRVEAFGAQLTTEYGWKAELETAARPPENHSVKLVHEGNLMDLVGTQKKLTLSKGQLITPAARDLAKARGIEITRP
jgi:hypothetical protein